MFAIHLAASKAALPSTLIGVAGAIIATLSQPLDTTWVGRPQNTALYVTVFAFSVAGCLAVLTGFVSGSDLVRDPTTLARRTIRPMSVLMTWRAAADLAWLQVGLFVAAAAAFTRTASYGAAPRGDSWSLGVLAMASLFATYCAGLAAGSLLRRPAWLVLVAPAPYGLTLYSSGVIAASESPETQQLFAPFIDQSWYPELVPNPWPVLALMVYVVCVGGLAAVLASLRVASLHRKDHTATAPAIVLLALTVLAGSHVAGSWSPNGFASPNAAGASCSPDGATCVWTDQRHILPVWRDAAATADRALAGLPHERLVFVQQGLGGEGYQEVHMFNPRPSVDELTVAMLGLHALNLLSDCGDGPDAGFAHDELLKVLVGRALNGQGEPTPDLSTEYAAIVEDHCA